MRTPPTPAMMVMHDYTNVDPADLPTWGPVGSWMWWGWDQLNPGQNAYSWPIVDAYLDRAAELGKPVALSMIPIPGPNQDTTPDWVYGGGAGWDDGNGGTYPAWNSWAWDQAFAKFVAAFGERYDGDPRVHSVWICTAMYGETVTNAEGCDLNGHNPGRFFANALSWYAEAFPTTPLYMTLTGPTNRRALALMCWEAGVNVRFCGLVRDARNQHGIANMPPGPDGGLMDIAQDAVDRGLPVCWEHAYNIDSPPEAYWAMITGAANGMAVFDTEIRGLDTIAAIPGLWQWVLDVANSPPETVAMWIARDTDTPPPGNQYESGYPGPWVRGEIWANAIVGGRDSALWRGAPAGLTEHMYGHGGIGRCDEDALLIDAGLPDGNYRASVIYAPNGNETWVESEQVVATVDGMVGLALDGHCWVHRIVILPTDDEPPPPPPEPPDVSELAAKVAETTEGLLALIDVVNRQDAELEGLEHTIDAYLGRIDALEAKVADLNADVGDTMVTQAKQAEAIEAVSEAVAFGRARIDALEAKLAKVREALL